MPISASDAWREAAASVTKEPMLLTLEFQHPSFVEEGVPIAIRVVANTEDMVFRIETGGTMNPNEDVRFVAIPFEADRPKIGEGGGAEWDVKVDNIGREISKYLSDATELNAEIIVILRGYLPSDATNVGWGPYRGVARNVKVSGATVTMTVTIADPQNQKFGRDTYDMVRFPALLAINL